MQSYGDIGAVMRRRFCEAEGDDMFMVGYAGQSFRLVLPFGQESVGLKTPGY